jgi:hypothetical protein
MDTSLTPMTLETPKTKGVEKTRKKRKTKIRIVERVDYKSLTKTLGFRITPLMNVWMDTAIRLVTDSPVEISAACGIDRGTYYKWMKLNGFKDWFYAQWKARRVQWIPQLDQMGMKRASKSFDYWRAMNQKAGELLEQANQTNITGDKVVAILGGMTLQAPEAKETIDMTGKNDKEIYGYDSLKEEGERPTKL